MGLKNLTTQFPVDINMSESVFKSKKAMGIIPTTAFTVINGRSEGMRKERRQVSSGHTSRALICSEYREIEGDHGMPISIALLQESNGMEQVSTETQTEKGVLRKYLSDTDTNSVTIHKGTDIKRGSSDG